jgi:parallel beta-helix repeat protein
MSSRYTVSDVNFVDIDIDNIYGTDSDTVNMPPPTVIYQTPAGIQFDTLGGNISDLTFTNIKISNVLHGWGIKVAGFYNGVAVADNIAWNGLKISNCAFEGMALNYTNNFRIMDTTIVDTNGSGAIYGSPAIRLANSQFGFLHSIRTYSLLNASGPRYFGLWEQDSSDYTSISNCRFENNTDYGIHVVGSQDRIVNVWNGTTYIGSNAPSAAETYDWGGPFLIGPYPSSYLINDTRFVAYVPASTHLIVGANTITFQHSALTGSGKGIILVWFQVIYSTGSEYITNVAGLDYSASIAQQGRVFIYSSTEFTTDANIYLYIKIEIDNS